MPLIHNAQCAVDPCRLWQAVTKVQRGQRLESDRAEWTVDEWVAAVQKLPQGASAVAALRPAWQYLDSRAAAALFKGLAKNGMAHHATELFDHLRCVRWSDRHVPQWRQASRTRTRTCCAILSFGGAQHHRPALRRCKQSPA